MKRPVRAKRTAAVAKKTRKVAGSKAMIAMAIALRRKRKVHKKFNH